MMVAARRIFAALVIWVAGAPSSEAGPANCLEQLKGAGAQFAAFPPLDAAAICQIDNPVRLSAITGEAGNVILADRPILSCGFALTFSRWVNNEAQPLAKSLLNASIAALGTGPGFDCRIRRGDTTTKLSEHAIGDAVDIAAVILTDKRHIEVKEAADENAASFAFLKTLRVSACAHFTTVLGPGANSAHQEHFHVDLAARKGGYRICE